MGNAHAQSALTIPIAAKASTEVAKLDDFKEIDWPDLMPQQDLDALMNPPAYIYEIEDGSAEDQLENPVQNKATETSMDRYQQALVSTNIKPEMDGQAVRIPGYVVPLGFGDEQLVTEFFLVPYFGACIHVPPPPPNQIIHIKYPKGLKLDALYDPFWVSGVLKTSLVENDMAMAAYAMDVKRMEIYSR